MKLSSGERLLRAKWSRLPQAPKGRWRQGCAGDPALPGLGLSFPPSSLVCPGATQRVDGLPGRARELSGTVEGCRGKAAGLGVGAPDTAGRCVAKAAGGLGGRATGQLGRLQGACT